MDWISHRGLCKNCVENTRQAFQQAVAENFSCLETDLRCTSDGVIVLHHDRSMVNTAGIDKNIDEITVDEFLSISLNDGQNGLILTDFIREFSAFHWIFDIKPETAEKVIDQLKVWSTGRQSEDWLLSNCRFLLWSDSDEHYLRTTFPRAKTLAKRSECLRAGIATLLGVPSLGGFRSGRTYSIPPAFLGLALYKKSFIDKYHRRGAEVLAYLPEHEEQMQAAIKAGVDEILSNEKPCKLPL